MKILFIGAGNMASAIAGGIISSGHSNASDIIIYDKNKTQYDKFSNDCIRANNLFDAVNLADYIFFSIKPQNIKEILFDLKNVEYEKKVFVSICAGVTIEAIEKELPGIMLVRAMPNTALLIGEGVTGLSKNSKISDESFDFIKSIFATSGLVTEIEESDINALTAITASSPAYVYLFIECMLKGAKELDFNYDNCLELICKTFESSAKMIIKQNKTPSELISMVKSPNGTTEKALNVFENHDIQKIISDAMLACYKRAEELSRLG